MSHETKSRRNFIRRSALGIGTAAFVGSVANAMIIPQSNKHKDQKKLHIVCMGAHPGDPEFGCGGTMIHYSDAGHVLSFLYLTRGEASDPSKTFSEMASLRTREAEASCKIINAKPLFAGQIDGNTVLDKGKNEELYKMILEQKPDILFSQWPIDTHPDHQVTGLLALSSWVRSGRQFHLYFYEVNTGSETMGFSPTDYVDIASVHERKKAAMFAHKTQSPEETYTTFFKPMEEFRGLEAGVKMAESFIHFKPAAERAHIFGLV